MAERRIHLEKERLRKLSVERSSGVLRAKLAMLRSAADRPIRLHAGKGSSQSAPRIRLCVRSVIAFARMQHARPSSREYRHAISCIAKHAAR